MVEFEEISVTVVPIQSIDTSVAGATPSSRPAPKIRTEKATS